MRTRAFAVGLAVAVASCCYIHRTATCELDDLTKEYDALVTQHGQLQPGPERTAVETKLADVASKAAAAGRDAPGGDAPTAVALDRLAVLAAWQAGKAGEPMLLAASEQGAAACARLPQGDASRPGDCAMLKLATILAVGDSLQRDLRAITADLDRLRQANATAKLPAETRPKLEHLFDGFEAQFGKATQLRKDMDKLGVDQPLKDTTDSDRAVIYCSATTSLSRLLDVQGVTPDSIQPMIDRNNAMKTQIEASGHAVDCRALAATPLALPAGFPAS